MGRVEPTTAIVPFTALVDRVMTSEPCASARRVFWVVENGASHRGRWRQDERCLPERPHGASARACIVADPASPPASTKTSRGQRLSAHARERWPQLHEVSIRFHCKYTYVTGQLPGGQELPLCRLRYVGSPSTWGFAIYRASHDDYETSSLPSGYPAGTPEEVLDCADGL